jgi:uncharacterized protein (DUF1800 family)
MSLFRVLRRRVFALTLGLSSLFSGSGLIAAPVPSAEEKAAHALNRLGYGPRPGEVAQVAATGVENWIRLQLSPGSIPDPAADAALAGLEKLKLGRADLLEAYQSEIRQRNALQRAQAAKDFEAAGRLRTAMMESEQAVVSQALGELQHAKLARAVLSERQLQEVLVDFWFNHFNVDARKQQVRATVISYEQDVIRPHVFGNFRDLLGATAKSASMLVYLDNFRSSREMEMGPREREAAERLRREVAGEDANAPAPEQAAPMKRGLNENYGRELLELHTLGANAGYTQTDVQEVARAFTGWTIDPRSGAYVFRRAWHDDGAKKVLGTELAGGGGARDGEKVLDLLCAHPATAKRIATKLCQRFVADEPPAVLVERVARAFRDSKGDLGKTYEALFLSPEFFAAANLRAKIKSPFEFAASSLRATGAKFVEVEAFRGRLPLRAVEAGAALGRGGERLDRMPRKTVLLHLVELGQSSYVWGPPTGFPEDSSHWVSAGALVSRLNFALALTSGQVADAKVYPRSIAADVDPERPEELVSALARAVLGSEPGASTRRVLVEQATSSREGAAALPDVPRLLALILGSPEFQRR